MTRTLPQLAVDMNYNKARFPLWGFAKIDGVRAVKTEEGFTGRSMDPFKNTAINALFVDDVYNGFDGELTIDGLLTDEGVPLDKNGEAQSLCSATTGLVNRSKLKKGELDLPSYVVWNLFDWLHENIIDEIYADRYTALANHLNRLQIPNVRLLPYEVIANAEQAIAFAERMLELGHEGAIFRDPMAKHKSGRATETLNDFWRFKPASDKDAEVLSIYEAMENQNEATTNSLGRTERSSHAENKIGKGMAGGFICRDLASGDTIKVGAGCMKHGERVDVFKDPTLIVGDIIKYRSLDTGVKDAPRQARYISRRAKEDVS